jgi:hypothetical protein
MKTNNNIIEGRVHLLAYLHCSHVKNTRGLQLNSALERKRIFKALEDGSISPQEIEDEINKY